MTEFPKEQSNEKKVDPFKTPRILPDDIKLKRLEKALDTAPSDEMKHFLEIEIQKLKNK